MPLIDSLPPAVRSQLDQLADAGAPVVTRLRDAAERAGDTALTLAYAYVGVLDLAQERILRAARVAR